MFLSNLWVKTRAQKLLVDVAEVGAYGRTHPNAELQRRATADSADFLEQLDTLPPGFPTARELMLHALANVELQGTYVELGVFKGASSRFIAKRLPKDATLHGFDSFRGLPPGWSGNRLRFDARGKLPRVPKNVKLHVGYFEETLPGWVNDYPNTLAFLHVDCDIYESTRVAFENLGRLLAAGSVVVFDEYFNYPGWRDHEHRAFEEFADANSLRCTPLGYTRIQMAFRIDSIDSTK